MTVKSPLVVRLTSRNALECYQAHFANCSKVGLIRAAADGPNVLKYRPTAAGLGTKCRSKTCHQNASSLGGLGPLKFLATTKVGRSWLFAAGTTASTHNPWKFDTAGIGGCM